MTEKCERVMESQNGRLRGPFENPSLGSESHLAGELARRAPQAGRLNETMRRGSIRVWGRLSSLPVGNGMAQVPLARNGRLESLPHTILLDMVDKPVDSAMFR